MTTAQTVNFPTTTATRTTNSESRLPALAPHIRIPIYCRRLTTKNVSSDSEIFITSNFCDIKQPHRHGNLMGTQQNEEQQQSHEQEEPQQEEEWEQEQFYAVVWPMLDSSDSPCTKQAYKLPQIVPNKTTQKPHSPEVSNGCPSRLPIAHDDGDGEDDDDIRVLTPAPTTNHRLDALLRHPTCVYQNKNDEKRHRPIEANFDTHAAHRNYPINIGRTSVAEWNNLWPAKGSSCDLSWFTLNPRMMRLLMLLCFLAFSLSMPPLSSGDMMIGRSAEYLNAKNLIYHNNTNNHRPSGSGVNVKTTTLDSGGGANDVASNNITGIFAGDLTVPSSSTSAGGGGGVGYLDKLDNLERSVAAVLIKVAYGTTSTTKRSIPDNSYVPTLTTVATPLLTTSRYLEKSPHQQQINLHHRNYELDLERDHALPTSAPNADILKSNSNPTYPNPNRHHHERERHRHIVNSTPLPSLPNTLKKSNGQPPTIPMYPGDIPSYSPPARSFFTPPLPPEYQNPFADKPTLRGTNNEGVIANTGTYINRRPIPPPSLMPGHERIPFRPPDLAASTGGNGSSGSVWPPAVQPGVGGSSSALSPVMGTNVNLDSDRKKALNTPSRSTGSSAETGANRGQPNESKSFYETTLQTSGSSAAGAPHNTRKEVLPSIRRILSGSNGNKGEVPEVLLKQATSRPLVNYHQPPSSPVVLLDGGGSDSSNGGGGGAAQQNDGGEENGSNGSTSNINKSKSTEGGGVEAPNEAKMQVNGKTKISAKPEYTRGGSSTPATAAAIDGSGEKGEGGEAAKGTGGTTTSTMSSVTALKNVTQAPSQGNDNIENGATNTAAAASTNSTGTIAWNVHVYFSVVLFTILAVYSLYKVLTYNKLTHLFSQSYFVCIHLILIVICATRIFYLCYDAYNIHATFSIFVSEVLLNLPSTFLTISFSVLILFLFRKALNHKNNRYSALIRPLTVVVGCGVHVVLCITLHYVESYTLQQQHLLYQQQQQQQQLLYRRYQHQQQQQQQFLHQQQHHQQQPHHQSSSFIATANSLAYAGSSLYAAMLQQQNPATAAAAATVNAPPPRVLSLICQIIYIFVCLFLGLLYLYLYRILKRILRSKSQNYIHGYQNLSYAIHITIATALLFVLLAILQIFGAISISTTRPLIQQLTTEIDWLQWGYQSSLRLIEIAIITLLSWVAGLKTGSGGATGPGGGSSLGNGDARYGGAHGGGSNVVFSSGDTGGGREKHSHHHHNHSNMAGFFLPCTSSSSQEQFDTDYPAVCNANTNLHTYTMRTGKLIYNDSFALNSLSAGGGGSGPSSQLVGVASGNGRNAGDFQLQSQPTYQRPYDTGSLHSGVTASHVIADYGGGPPPPGANRYSHEAPQYADYLTDATTDHYENPNFDLHGLATGPAGPVAMGMGGGGLSKFNAKTSTTSTTASSSGGSGSSAVSQQQMLLLQSDSCYSEPLQPAPAHASNYDFNNFERPQHEHNGQALIDCWSESLHMNPTTRGGLDPQPGLGPHKREKSSHLHTTLDRSAYENPERRSSNSTHSCASSGGRYASYNSFERGGGPYNGVRKSGTLSNISNGSGGGGGSAVNGMSGIIHGRNSSSSSAASSNVSAALGRPAGIQTLALSDRHHHQQQQQQRSGRSMVRGGGGGFGRSSLERHHAPHIPHPSHPLSHQHQQLQQSQNSDDDIVLSGSNVERTTLINNEDGSSCLINSNSTASNSSGISSQLENEIKLSTTEHLQQQRLFGGVKTTLPLQLKSNNSAHSSKQQARQFMQNDINGGGASAEASSTASSSSTTNTAEDDSGNGEVLISEQGFARFRALDDINNAQGVGIHNASTRKSQYHQGQMRGGVAGGSMLENA